jgi:hypothetical protein
LRNADPLAQWGDKYRRVVEHWRQTRLQNLAGKDRDHHEAELFGVSLNGVILLGANAEVFSEFTDLLRRESGRRVYVVGYANGDVGYLPPRRLRRRRLRSRGGPTCSTRFPPAVGSLELLAREASELLRAF